MSLQIHVENHFCHAVRDLNIPMGVTLITGPNGAGKSSLTAEAIAVAVYGKTVRGAALGDTWLTRVTSGDFGVERSKSKKATTLKATLGGVTPAFETTTRAQEAIEAHLGLDFAGWRRTHLFSAAGLSQFSEATDAERKRLLEGLLGLERFDKALAACRSDLTAVRSRLAGRLVSLGALRRIHDEAREDVAQCTRDLHDVEDEEDDPGDPPLDIDGIHADLTDARDRLAALDTGRIAATRHASLADDRLRRARDAERSGVCGSCQRPFDDSDPEALRLETRTAKAEADKAATALAVVNKDHEAARKAVKDYEGELARAEASNASLERAKAAKAGAVAAARAQLAAFAAREAAADRDLEDAELAEEADQREHATLTFCEKVLGLKGARALVLGDALDALEAEANECLGELCPGAYLEIGGKGTTIDITVTGLGGARTYEDASAGERCRIDVALLLAIAAIAPQTRLPLIFDDVFGTLDEDGVDAAARLLLRIGENRPVIVITQLDSLVSRMRGVAQVVSL